MNLLNLTVQDAIEYVLTTKKPYFIFDCILRPARGKICIEQYHKLKYMEVRQAIQYLNVNFKNKN